MSNPAEAPVSPPSRGTRFGQLQSGLAAIWQTTCQTLRGCAQALEFLLWTAFFLFAITILGLRYVVLPTIENYRPDLEAALTKASGVPVSIGKIKAGWDGLNPDLDLHDVVIKDAAGRNALKLPFVSVTLSWKSLGAFGLRFAQLEIVDADLAVRRDAQGRIAIAGLSVSAGPSDGQGLDWLLQQREIVVRNASIRWTDEARGAPELVLTRVNLLLENGRRRHLLGFQAVPPAGLASTLEARAELYGSDASNLKSWAGSVYAVLNYANVAAWRPWVDVPADVKRGTGGVRAWLNFKEGHVEEFTADVALDDVVATLRRDLAPLALRSFSGRVGAREVKKERGWKNLIPTESLRELIGMPLEIGGFEVTGRKVALETVKGVKVAPVDFLVRNTAATEKDPIKGEIKVNALDFAVLAELASHLPLDPAILKGLNDYKPQGQVFDLQFAWNGDLRAPATYGGKVRFSELSLASFAKLPGFHRLSGVLEATKERGTLYLNSRNAALDFPTVFENARVELDELSGQFAWSFPKNVLEVKFEQVSYANSHAAGTAFGLFRGEAATEPRPDGRTRGYLDVTAKLSRGDGRHAWRYLPLPIPKGVRDYVQNGIQAATTDNLTGRVKGNIADFPYPDGKSGIFRIEGRANNAEYLFADGWPKLSNLQADLLFERDTMEIVARSASSMGTKIGTTTIRIPGFAKQPAMLEIAGTAEGATAEFLKYIDASPVDAMIDRVTEPFKAQGAGKLALKISMPLGFWDRTKLTGSYQLINNTLNLSDDLPALSQVNGKVDFTESSLRLSAISGVAVGGPFSLNGATSGSMQRATGVLSLTAQGSATPQGLGAWLRHPAFAAMGGQVPWNGTINLRRGAQQVVVESSLTGLTSSLPAPFAKTAEETLPFRFVRSSIAGKADEDEITVSLAGGGLRQVQGRFERKFNPAAKSMLVTRGALAVNSEMPRADAAGVALAVSLPQLDVERWQAHLDGPVANQAGASSLIGVVGSTSAFPISSAVVVSPDLIAFGRSLNDARVSATFDGRDWKAKIASREMEGDLNWRGAQTAGQGGAGRLRADLSRLKLNVIPGADSRQAEQQLEAAAEKAVGGLERLPAIDLKVEEFEINAKKLGKLDLVASNTAGEWRIHRLNLTNPDATLAGSGAWRARAALAAGSGAPRVAPKRRVDLDFTLEVKDSGLLLDRLGYPKTLQRGTARLEGSIAWNGVPVAIDYSSLSGDLKLKADKGQFLKADPGIAKLIGIMSLQALPRRITLDFRDVFSDGFSYDTILATGKLNRGVMTMNDFKMTGVSAAVLMSGDIDLGREVQNLRVLVIPDLGGGVGSLITALTNPLLGLVTFLAQQALKDPLGKALAFEYAVTGSWGDPKIERQQRAVAQARENSPADSPTPVPPVAQ